MTNSKPKPKPLDFNPTYSGLRYPITKTPGPWLVIGVTTNPPEWRDECGLLNSLDIHFAGDDPNYPFERPEDWPELPASVIKAYNLPGRASSTLAIRRALDLKVWSEIQLPAYEARNRMHVVRAMRERLGRNALCHCGGFVCCEEDLDWGCHLDSYSAFLATIDLWRARMEHRYKHADTNRATINRLHYHVAVKKDGSIMFWRMENQR